MINAKLDKILKLITPVISVSKEMKKKHDDAGVVIESIETVESTDEKPKKAKKAKKAAKSEDALV
jgi:hypothetical protein